MDRSSQRRSAAASTGPERPQTIVCASGSQVSTLLNIATTFGSETMALPGHPVSGSYRMVAARGRARRQSICRTMSLFCGYPGQPRTTVNPVLTLREGVTILLRTDAAIAFSETVTAALACG